MTRVRLGLAVALVALTTGGIVAAPAVAAPSGSANASSYSLHKTPIQGVAKNGKKFTGTYAIQRFTVATVNGTKGVYAVGTVTGTLKGRHVSRSNVMMPAKLTAPKSTRQAAGGTCTILHLVLGPINLSLLGLNVNLGGGTITPGQPAQMPITLNLTGTQGGGLLGSLLCGLDNALGSGSHPGRAEQQPAATVLRPHQHHFAAEPPLGGERRAPGTDAGRNRSHGRRARQRAAQRELSRRARLRRDRGERTPPSALRRWPGL